MVVYLQPIFHEGRWWSFLKSATLHIIKQSIRNSFLIKTSDMKKCIFMMVAVALAAVCLGQEESKKVLFVGNSYTYVNNLPQMIQQLGESSGCRMEFEQVTPGGATFSQHCNTSGAMESIGRGGWDAVVLQAQSQEPSFPWSQFTAETYPYACQLADAVYEKNECPEVVFYMTWGRKNGDTDNAPYFDSLATYEGMDDLLCARYTYMAQQNKATVSPVGKVWRRLREEHGEIELYQSDASHPSLAGSYAAACTFYTILFREDPTQLTADLGVDAAMAQTIRETTKAVVYDSIWRYSCHAFIGGQQTGDEGQWQFSCQSAVETEVCSWDFGDGEVSTEVNPSHTYSNGGTYDVTLIAGKRCHPDTTTMTVRIGGEEPVGIPTVGGEQTAVSIYPNPATEHIIVNAAEGAEIKIVDMQGRVRKTSETKGSQRVSTADLEDGIYMVVITGKGGVETRRIKIAVKHR